MNKLLVWLKSIFLAIYGQALKLAQHRKICMGISVLRRLRAQSQPLSVFISSPGDVRKLECGIVCAALEDLNADRRLVGRYRLMPYMYEKHVPPKMGEPPQWTVDKYMMHASRADIFICILWRRMGTPIRDRRTDREYLSGTMYEFLSAGRAYRRTSGPIILLYRSMKSPLTEEIGEAKEQSDRVQAFFDAVDRSPYAGMCQKFSAKDDFRALVRKHVLNTLTKEFCLPEQPDTRTWLARRLKQPAATSILFKPRQNPAQEAAEILLVRTRQEWAEDFLLGTTPDRSPPFIIPASTNGEPIFPVSTPIAPPAKLSEMDAELADDSNLGTGDSFYLDEYLQADGQLLILGDSGSGKSFVLATLVRDLIQRADAQDILHVPVVFHLFSWAYWALRHEEEAASVEGFASWLISELVEVYRIPRRTAKLLVKNEALVICLDGLDEITCGDDPSNQTQIELQNKLRADCLRAINRFFNDDEYGSARMVLCCGADAYAELSLGDLANARPGVQIQFPGGGRTLRLEPLDLPQVYRFLNADWDLAELKRAVEGDAVLQELVTAPYLLKMMLTAYRYDPQTNHGNVFKNLDRDERLRDLFSKYVTSCFSSLSSMQEDRLHQTRKFLKWLATTTSDPTRTRKLLLVEKMQPDWLPSRDQSAYRLLTALLFACFALVTVGAPVGFALGLEWGHRQGWVNGLEHGVTTFFVTTIIASITVVVGFYVARNWLFGGVLGLIFALARSCAVGLSAESWGWEQGLRAGIITALPAVPLLAGFFAYLNYRRDEIHPLEPLSWDWRRALGGLLAGIVVGLVFWIAFDPGRGLGFGCMAALTLMFAGGYAGTGFEAHARPNQGIVQSIRTAVIVGAFLTVFGMIVMGLSYGLVSYGKLGGHLASGKSAEQGFVNALETTSLLTTMLFFGGTPALQHAGLRWAMRRAGLIPRHFVGFLENLVKLQLLRRHGGGYKFPHEQLRLFFAKQT